MAHEYLLVDLENVTPQQIPDLLENQIFCIFTGDKQNKISRDLVISTQPFGKQVQWIKIDGSGKNAADFHIAFYLGEYSAKEKDVSFTILSKDTGFDPLIRHLVSRDIRCKRITDVRDFNKPKTGPDHKKCADDLLSDPRSYFLRCNQKVRPKKTKAFIAFIKSRGIPDENLATMLMEKMAVEGLIEIKDGKINYLLDKAAE